ncbi:NADH-quinone oxidoreductase subunit NuoF [bacterium]|nr:NADH-quinone oxidoreductase subunit NuoF [bacterium]
MRKISSLEDLNKVKEEGLKRLYPEKTKIMVGMATCGLATGAGKVYDALAEEIVRGKADVLLSKTGCLGFCQQEPLLDIILPGGPRLTYARMTPEKAKELVDDLTSFPPKPEWIMSRMEEEEEVITSSSRKHKGLPNPGRIPTYQEHPFFAKQKKLVLRNCGFIDPDSIEEYIGRGGYISIQKALASMTPEEVIEEVKISGLRGRGGAGFPTGLKWQFCRQSEGDEKYIICNADEGDPGAYMDRSVLEGDPHAVIEGMLIGAFAIGAGQGYLYVRSEYPLAIERLKRAIGQARDYGLLGENIFGSKFSFDLEITQGAGAFVCGEETSLIASIEGRPAEPRIRPPFPAQKGLFGKPTNINNVETWTNIAVIIARGGDWYSSIGTEKSKGTKVFSLVGKVKNTGLVEVPMGITLREIIYDIGGGILNDKRLKAVQTGGPSGGCVPESLIDSPVDYERLAEAGSIMGSGGMVVMDEDTCVVDISKFFLDFTQDESCGKCTSCREGTGVLLEVLERISAGEGREEDLDFLEELAQGIKDASLCGLGQTAPNPVLSTLRYFRDEYKAHIVDKKCPAGVCKALITIFIYEEKCKACGLCKKVCPIEAIIGEKKLPHSIDLEKCVKCKSCIGTCKFEAIVVE